MTDMINNMSTYEKARNLLLFIIGAFILVLEIEWHDETRGWVIALSLILMGVVTIDQVKKYLAAKSGQTDVTPIATPMPKHDPPTQPPAA